MNSEEKPTLKDSVLSRIKEEELTMRPKMYFTLKAAALIAVAFAVLAVSILVFNFIFFSLRIAGHESLLGFGPRGILAFLMFFPWFLLFLDVLLIILFEWLLRQFRFGYKFPVLNMLFGILAATFLFGLILDRGTPFNDRLLGHADMHRLPPPFNGFYEGARRMPPRGSGLCKCVITAISGNTLEVVDTRGDATTSLKVFLPENDPHATTSLLAVGDLILVAGDESDGVVYAFGIRKIQSDDYFIAPTPVAP